MFCLSSFSFAGVLRPVRVGRESDAGNKRPPLNDRLPDDDPRKLAADRKDSTHQ